MIRSGRMAVVAFCFGILGACASEDADSELDASQEDSSSPDDEGDFVPFTTTLGSAPSPACTVSGKALYVVEDAANMNAGDAMAQARLVALGLTVTTRSDEQLVAGDATGKQIIVISSTVGST